MKKTLIINIGNTIIHFEEDAFEALTNYLNGIKAHFASTADNFEIVTDIENRIAEMLNELLAEQQKQVVNLDDAQTVMARMGSLSDFEEEETRDGNPKSDSYGNFKRLYRDVDDKVVAGVCAGIAHYLNVEIGWVRFAALVTITLGGSGILGYIIFWIIMPPANTRTEKMAMRGEAANLQGFKRNFDEELAAFRKQVKNANAQFEPYVRRTGNALTDFAGSLGHFIEAAAKVFFKVIAVMIIIMGVGVLLALLISLAVVFGIWDSNIFDYFPFTIINNGDQDSLLFAAFITCFVPVLALVLFSIRVAFNKRAINRTLSFALLTIWLCGVAFTAYYISRITTEFREHAELTQSAPLSNFKEFTLDLDQSMLFNREDSTQYHLNYKDMDGRVIVYDDDAPFREPRNVSIDIQKGDRDTATLTRFYEANGRDFKTAIRNAQQIDYKFSQNGNKLMFSPALVLKQAVKWRAQEVHLVLKVPVGTILHISYDLYPHLSYYSWNCSEEHSGYTDWIMTEDGLKCQAED